MCSVKAYAFFCIFSSLVRLGAPSAFRRIPVGRRLSLLMAAFSPRRVQRKFVFKVSRHLGMCRTLPGVQIRYVVGRSTHIFVKFFTKYSCRVRQLGACWLLVLLNNPQPKARSKNAVRCRRWGCLLLVLPYVTKCWFAPKRRRAF